MPFSSWWPRRSAPDGLVSVERRDLAQPIAELFLDLLALRFRAAEPTRSPNRSRMLMMATRNPLARGKRERERARAEKQKEKAVRRAEARARRGHGGGDGRGEDPDIAGIVPGPQANPWGDELPPDETDEADEAGEAEPKG
jgi:hypothetical protein